jgi:integrase
VLINADPDQSRLMVETAIETGMRWGELTALKPRHVDLCAARSRRKETILEVSKKHSLTAERFPAKPYPEDNEARTFAVRQDWLDAVAAHITIHALARDDLLSRRPRGPRSRAISSAPGSGDQQ